MMKLSAVFLFLLVSGGAALAQSVIPTSTPPADEDKVVKITTALIQIDLSVKDKDGRTITDLRPDEIEIYENGERQKITNFSFVSNPRSVGEFQKRKTRNGSLLPPANDRPPRALRTIALVVDDLTLSFESLTFVRDALNKFVDEQMQDGDLVAVVRTGAGIGALQQFTNDRRQLHAAIDRLRWNPLGSGNISTYNPTESKFVPRFGGRAPSPGERTLQGLQREFEDTRQSVFATGSLESVKFIVRGMQDLPGRKSIMFLSDGFRMYNEDAVGFRESGPVMNALRKLIDVANRASVVIHTVEARGLQANGLTAADSTNGWSRDEIAREVSDRRSKISDSQDTLTFIAEQTGGEPLTNNSDLAGGIRRILDDQSYYLLGYEPNDTTFDPKARRFNDLEIKVTRPDTVVRYRSGFFAVTDDAKAKPLQTPGERLTAALTSPFAANDIALRLNALYYNSPKGGVVRSLIHVRAQDLEFKDEPDGRKKVIFDVVAVAFGDNGVAVDQKSETQTLIVKKDIYDEFMRSGFVYDSLLPVKKAGPYQVRVAFRDHATERIGSASQFIDVPDAKGGQLILSGVVLENVAYDDWQRQRKGEAIKTKTDPLKDTSLRSFKQGTVLNYGFTIYNAKFNGTRAGLTYQTRIFRDGKLLFEGKSQPVPTADPSSVNFTSALLLGTEMTPGDYILQVVVTDNLARGKNNTSTQFVPFEIVDR